jgi:glycosyltransferase involved in cell wall biosynthesis
MAKVLMLLTNPFRPDPRVHREAKALVKAGYGVTIFAWDRDGGSAEREGVDGICIARAGPRAGWGTALSVLPGLILFSFKAVMFGLRSRPSVVHAHDFDTLMSGVLISKMSGSRLVYDAHEGYSDMIAPTVPKWASSMVRRIEMDMARKSDLVVTVNSLFKGEFENGGARSVEVVGNLPDSYGISEPERLESLRKEMGAGDRTIVLYVGVLEPQRALIELIRAFKALPSEKYFLAVGGYGTLESAIKAEAKGMKNFKFLGRVAATDVLTYSAASDALFAVYDPSNNNNRKGAPNKLYEALHLGKPIIVAEGTFAETESVKAGIGHPVAYGDIGAIASAIKGLPRTLQGKVSGGPHNRRWTWDEEAQLFVGYYSRLGGVGP